MKKIVIALAVLASVVVLAQTVGTRVQWVDFVPQASNPVTAGRTGSYMKTDGTLHSVTSAGVDVDVTAGGNSYQTVQEEGSNLTQRRTLNFSGAGITCADDTTRTTCTVASGATDTLQTAYTAMPASAPANMTLDSTRKNVEWLPYGGQPNTETMMSFKRDGLGLEAVAPTLTLRNTSASTGGSLQQSSPTLELSGTGWDQVATGSKADSWGIINLPLIDGLSVGEIHFIHKVESNDTGNGAGNWATAALFSDNFTVGETTLELPLSRDTFCAYPEKRTGSFYCTLPGRVSQGVSLASPHGTDLTAALGFSPKADNTTPLGNYDVLSRRWLQVVGAQLRGIEDVVDTSAPTTFIAVSAENNTAATVGAQKRSPSIGLHGAGWDVTGATSRFVRWYLQDVPVQESSGPPTGQLQFTSSIFTVGTVLDAVLESFGGGSFYVQHFGGRGTAPTVVAGSGSDCASAATIALDASASDAAFTLTFTTGAAACAAGIVATITYNSAFRTKPHVVISSADADSITAAGQSVYVDQATSSTTALVLVSASALAGATEYVYNGVIIQ